MNDKANEIKAKMVAKIAALSEDALQEVIVAHNKPRNKRTAEDRLVRALLLDEFENRHGVEMVDALIDKLDEMVAA